MEESKALTLRQLCPAVMNRSLCIGDLFVGIDFGTSTTVVSVARYNSTEAKIETESLQIPQKFADGATRRDNKVSTVIACANNLILVGEGASELKYQLRQGKDIWYSFKMELGEDLGAKYYESLLANDPVFKIQNPKDAARVFFMYLKTFLNQYCKEHSVSRVHYSVTIPASFEANQRKELMEALDDNDMAVERQSLIDEPNAAFLSYVQECQSGENPIIVNPNYNPKVLVFDFGAGTCDISILEIGKSATGLYSKNLAISKFLKLGGDDLDRYLVYHYLLPRFLEENNHKADDFRTKERLYIARQLYKAAERLKILLCKKITMRLVNGIIPEAERSSTEHITIEVPVELPTSKGVLRQNEFYLTASELGEAMKVFLKQSNAPTTFKGEEEYNNIFMSINSAVKKGNLDISELDYVLLIGGSAQNPYIQEALKMYFSESEILVPRDLQTHVSKGAAIHSLLMNGFGNCIIQPITSEPIIVVTKDSQPRVLLPAGTHIPSETIIVDDLSTSKDNQEAIELPICVGNVNKMLFNIRIVHPSGQGFPINTPVKLVVNLTADKLLDIHAECQGIQCTVDPQNPFVNKEITTEDRIVLKAERQANLEAMNNNGIPTKASLISLQKAYEQAGHSFKAAETLEQRLELYPDPSSYNNLGVLYHNSGVYDKAISFFEKGIKYNPNSCYVNLNMGNTLRCCGKRQESEPYIRRAFELNNNYYPALIEMGRMERRNGHEDQAQQYFQKAYDILYKDWKTNSLQDVDYSWFASLADEMGLRDMAKQIRLSRPSVSHARYYDEDNLTKTSTNNIIKQ